MRKNQKKKKYLRLVVILLLLISIGYAALTTTLTINGTANISATLWSVYFSNVVLYENNNVALVTTAPSVPEGSTTTTTLTWNVSMDTPGQVYAFNVDVVNGGTIDAMIENATNTIVTSTLTQEQQEYLDYTITYLNGAPIERYDKLSAGETKTITVRLAFKTDIDPEDLPETAQNGISLTYSTNYVQADENAVAKVTVSQQNSGTGVTLTSQNVNDYLGKIVTNYKTPNSTETITIGENEYTVSTTYRLYYVDFDNKYGDGAGTIYLKADSPEVAENASLQWEGASLATSVFQNLNPSLPAMTNSFQEDSVIGRLIWLLDTEVWGGLEDGINSSFPSEKINYVVATPTLEMMIDSYNLKYNLNNTIPDTSYDRTENSDRTKLLYTYLDEEWAGSLCAVDSYGYAVGPCHYGDYVTDVYGGTTSEYSVMPDNSIDKLYYTNSGYTYFLASPIIENYGESKECVVGKVGEFYYGGGGCCISSGYMTGYSNICPIVSLQPDVSLTFE